MLLARDVMVLIGRELLCARRIVVFLLRLTRYLNPELAKLLCHQAKTVLQDINLDNLRLGIAKVGACVAGFDMPMGQLTL